MIPSGISCFLSLAKKRSPSFNANLFRCVMLQMRRYNPLCMTKENYHLFFHTNFHPFLDRNPEISGSDFAWSYWPTRLADDARCNKQNQSFYFFDWRKWRQSACVLHHSLAVLRTRKPGYFFKVALFAPNSDGSFKVSRFFQLWDSVILFCFGGQHLLSSVLSCCNEEEFFLTDPFHPGDRWHQQTTEIRTKTLWGSVKRLTLSIYILSSWNIFSNQSDPLLICWTFWVPVDKIQLSHQQFLCWWPRMEENLQDQNVE